MFKRTNKMWKGIAVALAVCMLPTVAFAADSINTITVGADWVTYDAAENTVTVTGTIGADGVGNSDADVTILAVRSAEALTTLEGVDIQAQAVYIDQESFENGAFTFSFIPRNNVSGKVITVFVGGKGVQELKCTSVETGLPAGTLTLEDACKDMVDNNGVTLVYDVEGPDEWIDLLEANATLMNGDVEVTGITKELSNKTFTVTVPALAGETASYTLEVKNLAEYIDTTATGTAVVTAPTVKVKEAIEANKPETVYSSSVFEETDPAWATMNGTLNAEEKQKLFGKASVTLPAALDAYPGTLIAWNIDGTDVTSYDVPYALTRAASTAQAPVTSVRAIATITNGSYVTKTVEYDLIVEQIAAADHKNPSIDSVKMTVEEGKTLGGVGVKIKAETENFFDNWGLEEKTAFVWSVGGTEVTGEGENNEFYTPVENDLGKELKVVATPAVESDKIDNDTFTGTPKEKTVQVIPAADYKPEASVTISNITAKKAAEAKVNVEMYEGMTDGSTKYAWYKVAGVDSADKAIEAVKAETPAKGVTVTAIEGETAAKTSAEAFVKEDKGNYGVIKVTPVATYNETDYEGEAVYAACEITVAKTTGGAVQGGASLVTGTNKPATDDNKDDETTTPGTDVKDDDIISDTNPDGNPTDGKEYGAAQFTDISKETYAWAYDHIDALAKAKIVKGMTETTFGPEGETTVAQAVALAVRISGLTAENAKTDKVDEAHWSYAEMAIADTAGILAILGDKVEADKAASRETVFAIVYAAVKAAEITLPTDAEAITYSDASSIAEGAVEAINALTKAGVLNGMGDGTIAPKANITRAQLAKILGVLNAIIAE